MEDGLSGPVVRWRIRWRHLIAGAFFFLAGANHFRVPALYVSIMPPSLPWPLALVYLSGAAEMAGGLGLLWWPVRRAAGWGLIALLLAVWPANFSMALHGYPKIPGWVLWARLPLQFVFIAWVWWVSRPERPVRTRRSTFGA